jgi:hypothetical protein
MTKWAACGLSANRTLTCGCYSLPQEVGLQVVHFDIWFAGAAVADSPSPYRHHPCGTRARHRRHAGRLPGDLSPVEHGGTHAHTDAVGGTSVRRQAGNTGTTLSRSTKDGGQEQDCQGGFAGLASERAAIGNVADRSQLRGALACVGRGDLTCVIPFPASNPRRGQCVTWMLPRQGRGTVAHCPHRAELDKRTLGGPGGPGPATVVGPGLTSCGGRRAACE